MQLIAIIHESYFFAASLFALTVVLVICKHGQNNQILLFCIFILITPLEVILTEAFSLDYYYVLIVSKLPEVFLVQSLSLIPLLLIGAIPKVTDFPPLFFRPIYFFLIWVFTFLVVAFGIKGEIVFTGGYEVYQENLKKGSGLIEYSILLFVVLGAFKRNSLQSFAIFLLMAFYVLKCMALGFRIQAIMTSLLIVYIFGAKISARNIVFLAFFGGFLGLLAGILKHSSNFELLALVMNANYIQTPHNGALVSSTVILDRVDLSFFESVSSLLAWVVPRSILVDHLPWAYPMSYVQTMESTPGGSLFGVYGYAVGGWFGTFFVGVVISTFASFLRFYKGLSETKVIAFYLGMAFFVFFPRWVLYDFGTYGARSAFTLLVLVVLLLVLLKRRGVFRLA